jgi:UDP-glucose 4-epimerase
MRSSEQRQLSLPFPILKPRKDERVSNGPAMTAIAGATCLVLGGGGFIGTNLCRGLHAAGARVVGFGRRPRYPEALDGVEWIDGDFSDAAAVGSAVRGVDLVFHLLGAGLPEPSNRDPSSTVTEAILPSLNLLEACRDAGCRKLVFISSGGTVYGRTGGVALTETAPTDPISAYGVSKLAVEKYIQLFHHLYGLDYAILRVSNPFGPFQSAVHGQGLVASLVRNALTGEPVDIWGDGSTVRDYLFIDDLIDAILAAAIHQGAPRLFNVGSGTGRSVRDVVRDVAAISGRAFSEVRYLPARAADVPHNVLDPGLIARELGWVPKTSWLEGLRATHRWVERQSAR